MLRFTASPTIKLGFGFVLLLFLILIGFRPDTLPHNPNDDYSDATISRWPDALHFQRAVRDQHELPFWNAHLMGGQPFAANPGTKTWYPLTWLLIFWDAAFHINFMTAFHLWLAGIGMWVWARRTGLHFWPAILAAGGYLFAPKLLAHAGAGHIDLLMAMGWLPWLLVFIHRNFEKTTPFNIIGLAFVGAMTFIGAIQILLFTFGLGLTYTLYLMMKSRTSDKPALALGTSVLFGMGFAAVQWIPLLELQEAVSRDTMREKDAAIYSMKLGQWLGLLIGDHSGSVESLTYVGVSVFILALLGLILRPKENRFWWGVVIFAVLYSLGENFILWTGAVKVFPALLLFRVPSRAWFLAALVLPYLAGWGIQFIVETPPQPSRNTRLGIVALCGLSLTCSLSSFVLLSEYIKIGAIIGLVAFPITIVLLSLFIFHAVSPRVLMSLLTMLVIVDCLWMGQALIEGRPPEKWLNEKPPEVLENLHGRIYTPSYSIPQQDSAFWQMPRLDGVDPFQIKNFVEKGAEVSGVPVKGYSTTFPAEVVINPSEKNSDVQTAPLNPELLGRWGVAWVVTRYPIEIDGLEFVAQEGEDIFYYKNPFGWDESVQLEWDGTNRVTQTIQNPELIPFTVTNAPGWETKDGTPIDQNLLSLPPENGTFVYRPRGVYIGIIVSAVSYGLALLWLILHYLNGGGFGFLRSSLPR